MTSLTSSVLVAVRCLGTVSVVLKRLRVVDDVEPRRVLGPVPHGPKHVCELRAGPPTCKEVREGGVGSTLHVT